MTLLEVYPGIKLAHIALALLSGAMFAVRGAGALGGAAWPLLPWTRRLSQLIDSALLIAALMLLATLHLNPFATPWLQLKLALLVAYIVCGTLAMRRALTVVGRGVAYTAALACFTAMVAVARAHDPAVVLHWMTPG